MSSAMSTFNDPQLDCDYTLVSTDLCCTVRRR